MMKDFIGEMLGTFVLILFGCSSVAVAVLFNEYNSIFQIGMVWGLAVTLSVFLTRNICYAHLNPARVMLLFPIAWAGGSGYISWLPLSVQASQPYSSNMFWSLSTRKRTTTANLNLTKKTTICV